MQLCNICNSTPAPQLKLHSASSRIFWWVHHKVDGYYCAYCAERLYEREQSRNAMQGWFGPISAMATAIFLPKNMFSIISHRHKAGYIEKSGFRIDRVSHRALKKPSNWAVPILLVALLAIISTTSSGDSSTDSPGGYTIGSCLRDADANNVAPTQCSASDAVYRITDVVSASSACSSEYVDLEDGKFACISRLP